MRAQGAAPGAVSGELRGGLTIAGNTASIARLGLPTHVLEALRAEGVQDLHDWRALGRRRHQLFGIVPSTIKVLDAAARAART